MDKEANGNSLVGCAGDEAPGDRERDESSEVCRWFQGETRTLILEMILWSLPGRPKEGLQGLSGGRGSTPRWQHHGESEGWFINVCTNTLL